MGSPATDIRLITIGDAGAITEHIRRDRETKGRWEPTCRRTTSPWTGSAGASSGCWPGTAAASRGPG